MTTFHERYFVQITRRSGEWFDIDGGQSVPEHAKAHYEEWRALKPRKFLVRLVFRKVTEFEIIPLTRAVKSPAFAVARKKKR